ncbi:GGDEF domain-containing protein [Tolypothrix campylonemoides VB511288]|nr:GGDEF domain-containing protein [Tolypothrix campylonemoides VB511288]
MGRALQVLARWRVWAAALLCAWSGAVAAQPALTLDAGTRDVSLAPYTRYFHDVGGHETIETIIAGDAKRFAPLPGGNSAFGFQPDGAFWFHARLLNRRADEPRWLLVQSYALSDYIDVYARYPDGRIVHSVGGDHRPFAARSIHHRHPNFWIDLPAGTPVDVYVRVASESSMQVPLELYTPTAFTEASRDAQLGIGLYYGILLALFFYNLVLWLTLRDPSYFGYLFHISAFGLVLLTLNGLGFEYLWPNSAWMADHAVPLSICLAQIAMIQFTRMFLDTAQRWPWGDRIGLAIMGYFALLGLSAVVVAYSTITPVASASVFVSIGWVALGATLMLRRGYAPARMFLVAWGMFLLGTGIFTAVAFGLLPKTFLTEYGVQIGSALEMLLLSVALGYRYAALRNENDRIVREAAQQLEQQVEARTAELRSALQLLEDAHGRLRESSRRDALTGLHNRSHFREAFGQMLDEARLCKQPLSLLMLDLDHFKQINDRHGHLAGDQCLRWAAQVIGQTLRVHRALPARWGGEEFVIALPGYSLSAAAEVGEHLRRRLREEPCDTGRGTIGLSASIGVHEIDPDADGGIDAALQLADEALYTAKAGGRDCVRLWRTPVQA